MGATYKFRCNRCSLTAEVSGGPSGGMTFSTETMWCKTCRSLRDIKVANEEPWSEREGAPPLPTDPSLHELAKRLYRVRVPVEPRCHHCNGTALIQWTRRDPCPLCGSPVERGELSRLWD